jgi:ribosomal protein S18 acetylase RimI-like enzyme
MGPIQVEETTAVTPELVAAFARLLPQVTPSAPPLDEAALREIVRAPHTVLLVARDDGGSVVGSATLVVFRIPSGLRARLESVVVDQEARGRGVGEAICRAALLRAAEAGVGAVDLTSMPARAAANRLYERLGFQRRETNVYRFTFGSERRRG